MGSIPASRASLQTDAALGRIGFFAPRIWLEQNKQKIPTMKTHQAPAFDGAVFKMVNSMHAFHFAWRFSALACGIFVLLGQAAAHQSAAEKEKNREKIQTLPEVTVTGTSMATDLQTYPGSVSVVTQQQLQTASTPIDALRSVPGVSTGDDFGRGLGQSFHIRGFGYQSESRIIIMQDGVRRSLSMFSNHISSFRSDPDLLKRVEVVKGASSVQYGGGAIGGVVDMGMKTAEDFVPEGKDRGFAAKLQYEHNNYREAYLAGAFAPKDRPVEFMAYGKKGRRGDQEMSRVWGPINGKPARKVPTDEDSSVAYLQGGFKITPEQKISLSYFDYGMDVETVWQNLWHTSPSSTTGPVIGKLKQQDWVAKYTFRPVANPWLDLTATAFHSRGSYDRHFVITPNSYKNEDRRHGFRIMNISHFETGRAGHRLLLGMDYEKRNEDALFLRNGVADDFGSMPNTYTDSGIYGHLESSFMNGGLVLQVGGRYDRYERKVSKHDYSAQKSHFSPRVGLSVRVADGLYLLGNWSEAFRAPTPHETHSNGPLNPHYWYLPNYDLKPETARETEIGFSWTKNGLWAAHDSLQTKLMLFSGRIKDMITLKRVRPNETPPASDEYATYLNTGRVKRHGFEWTGTYQQTWGDAGFGYSRVRQTDRATGKNVPYTFADKLNVHGHWQAAPGLLLGLNIDHWFKPKQNPASAMSRGRRLWYVRRAFTVVDLDARWHPRPWASGPFGRDLEAAFGIRNVFDASYMNAANFEASSLVGKGRNVYFGLSTRF